jgi:hypothetical protein
MDNQRMKAHVFIVYIIYMKCVNVMVNHHLWLDVKCNFIYATYL